MIENRERSRCGRMATSLLIVLFILRVDSKSVAERNNVVGVVENSTRCGGDYSGYRYTVSSPRYPEAYPDEQNCVYRLRGSPMAKCDQSLNLEFFDFSLPPSENCLEDYVEIGEGAGSPLCGRVVGIRTYSSGEDGLVARFRGGRGPPRRRRFKILVDALPCTPAQIYQKERAEKTKNRSNEHVRNIDSAGVEEDVRFATGSSLQRSTLPPPPPPPPPLVESLDEKDDDRSKFFGEPTQVEFSTANYSRISSYLFVPAAFETKSASIDSLERIPDNARVAPPPREIFPPSRLNAIFRQASRLDCAKKLSPLDGCCYGVPSQSAYSEVIPVVDEVGGSRLDCGLKNSLANLEVTANFRQTLLPQSTIDYSGKDGEFVKARNPATSYGAPPGRETKAWLSSANFLPPRGSNQPPKLCCNSYFSGLRFFLASPGFPSVGYNGDAYDCVYSIIPYSLDICRMRFNFKFFNHGTEDYSCSNGYVEIDGRRLCGCKRGLSLTSIVTSAFPKILPIRYTGYPRSKFNGFFIEVLQESCSNGSPYSISRSKKEVGRWRNGKADAKVTTTTTTTTAESQDSPRPKRNSGYSYSKPNIGFSEYPGVWKVPITTDGRNQASNEMTTGGNLFSPLLTCQALSFIDWTIAAKEAYLRNTRCPWTNPLTPNYPGYRANHWIDEGAATANIYPEYPGREGGLVRPEYRERELVDTTDWPIFPSSSSKFPSRTDCEDVNVSEGIVSSPGYPNAYPDNLSKCFRFFKAPDSCQLEVAILDFDVENSAGCTKDYVTFGERNGRYCGRSLAGTKTSFDISRNNDIPRVCFVSDAFGSGRGFNIGFSQIPCR